MFSFTAVKYLHRMFLSFTHCSLHVCSVQLNQGTARQQNTVEPGGGRGAKCACMRGAVFVQTCQLFCFFVLWTYLGSAEHQLKGTKKNDSTVCLLAHSLKLLLLMQIFILNRKSSNVFISLKHLKHEHISHFNKLNCLANNSLHHSWRTVCEVSVLMLVLLSGYEPAYAVSPQDGVQSEACDEEDGEDQQPVDAPHGNAREGTEAVYVCHISIRAGFKTWNTQSWITHGCKFHLSGRSDSFYMTQNVLPTTQFWPFLAQTSKLYIM